MATVNVRRSSIDAVKLIKPNIMRRKTVAKALMVLGILIVAGGFVGFAVTGAMLGMRGGGKGFGQFGFIFIPFFAVPFGVFFAAFSSAKLNGYNTLASIVELIKMSDRSIIDAVVPEAASRVVVNNVYGTSGYVDPQKLLIVKKLIETGNLEGYEVVADKVVAKCGTLTESEAEEMFDEYVSSKTPAFGFAAMPSAFTAAAEKPVIVKCPDCGAPVGDNEKFCQYCGRRLR